MFTPQIIYWLEVNAALVLLGICYLLLLRGDTFFGARRTALLGILLTSFLYPLTNFSHWLMQTSAVQSIAPTNAIFALPEVVVSAKNAATASQASDTNFFYIFMAVYVAGAAWLMLRIVRELMSVVRTYRQNPKTTIRGQRVCLLPYDVAPHSFFRWIFISETQIQTQEMAQILLHEQAHARQLHSLDILLAELTCALCWPNPVAWLLRREIRLNHEFLADAEVVHRGCNRKAYEYMMIGVRPQKMAIAKLYNNFNVLLLKKRIIMLNKKRTKRVGRLKYLALAAVGAVLLLTHNMLLAAPAATAEGPKAPTVFAPNPEQNIASLESSASPQKPKTIKAKKSAKTEKATKTGQEAPTDVVDRCEIMPEYPGGFEALFATMKKLLKYPASAVKDSIQGRVCVQFVVMRTGEIEHVKVIKSVDPALDAEALRVINAMKCRWKPGIEKGNPVNVKYMLPVIFHLK